MFRKKENTIRKDRLSFFAFFQGFTEFEETFGLSSAKGKRLFMDTFNLLDTVGYNSISSREQIYRLLGMSEQRRGLQAQKEPNTSTHKKPNTNSAIYSNCQVPTCALIHTKMEA